VKLPYAESIVSLPDSPSTHDTFVEMNYNYLTKHIYLNTSHVSANVLNDRGAHPRPSISSESSKGYNDSNTESPTETENYKF
jgi:hypothetical protein